MNNDVLNKTPTHAYRAMRAAVLDTCARYESYNCGLGRFNVNNIYTTTICMCQSIRWLMFSTT